jgi:hypothetical protein
MATCNYHAGAAAIAFTFSPATIVAIFLAIIFLVFIYII